MAIHCNGSRQTQQLYSYQRTYTWLPVSGLDPSIQHGQVSMACMLGGSEWTVELDTWRQKHTVTSRSIRDLDIITHSSYDAFQRRNNITAGQERRPISQAHLLDVLKRSLVIWIKWVQAYTQSLSFRLYIFYSMSIHSNFTYSLFYHILVYATSWNHPIRKPNYLSSWDSNNYSGFQTEQSQVH